MTVEDRYHYQVIRRAISHIDQAKAPVTLEGLATDLGMSSQHFQKVFSKWAGVSPKRYQQYLTLDHAKTLMKTRHTLLDVASDVGLTSTGRLHDLFLRWEAMSPGDYARKGAGLHISFAWLETPFGEALAMATPRGLCGLGFTSEIGRAASFADLSGRWPNATFVENIDEVRPFVDAALSGGTAQLQLIGGPFQIKVWEALLSIPSGEVTTYGDIATAIGNPKAVRAVGTAVGRNPISWLIPCHRVLRKSGDLGGYHWGTPVKRALLAYETVRSEARP
ncbi:methylated-DNA--[protein]-cysteine S-methyltransferase [Pacificibacter marinus]|uniref:methylated-DNA--[protein]-cysteine S-methyltransferase n=1 Tax=Pacificibacter marinus TaxID=658057 RepID=UPI001C06EB7D|nr:bifunctional helix-turn-helix domain-containing protein/methylated-DNA--[protein]-cysteine S-methyltransferase [Pacificibacter marinus]MBU2865935.1 bifunctional helix-turn-helix domain-containing protein/methylated-DNA--[protein]-cysteine S-methyltransferase [Pacificibacter marinus]